MRAVLFRAHDRSENLKNRIQPLEAIEDIGRKFKKKFPASALPPLGRAVMRAVLFRAHDREG